MAQSQYPNSGILGKARQPKVNPKSPDYNGNLDVEISLLKEMIAEAEDAGNDSVKINMGAWIREGQNGKFFSIKVSTYRKPDVPRAGPAPQISDDDIPF
jgi:hypothetical protein